MKKDARIAETVDMTGFQNGGGGNLTASRNISKFAFTMAGGGQAAPIFGWMARRVAFTMAEILLSLTIIGVVAAITLPSLMGNINERTWNTQRKALHARMSQAIAMMPQLNGYGSYNFDEEAWSVTEDSAAETFLTEGLSKVLKINNICDNEHLEDCGLTSTVYNLHATVAYSSIPKDITSYTEQWSPVQGSSIKTAAFETQNGESILLMYNPYCKDFDSSASNNNDTILCANFIYDLNGAKGPNTFGKDVGVIAALNSTDSKVIAPIIIPQVFSASKFADMGKACFDVDKNTRVATMEETFVLLVNNSLTGYNCEFCATSTKFGFDAYYMVYDAVPNYNVVKQSLENFYGSFYCVKR